VTHEAFQRRQLKPSRRRAPHHRDTATRACSAARRSEMDRKRTGNPRRRPELGSPFPPREALPSPRPGRNPETGQKYASWQQGTGSRRSPRPSEGGAASYPGAQAHASVLPGWRGFCGVAVPALSNTCAPIIRTDLIGIDMSRQVSPLTVQPRHSTSPVAALRGCSSFAPVGTGSPASASPLLDRATARGRGSRGARMVTSLSLHPAAVIW
jgi:hypothetical protein